MMELLECLKEMEMMLGAPYLREQDSRPKVQHSPLHQVLQLQSSTTFNRLRSVHTRGVQDVRESGRNHKRRNGDHACECATLPIPTPTHHTSGTNVVSDTGRGGLSSFVSCVHKSLTGRRQRIQPTSRLPWCLSVKTVNT